MEQKLVEKLMQHKDKSSLKRVLTGETTFAEEVLSFYDCNDNAIWRTKKNIDILLKENRSKYETYPEELFDILKTIENLPPFDMDKFLGENFNRTRLEYEKARIDIRCWEKGLNMDFKYRRLYLSATVADLKMDTYRSILINEILLS